ncbi:GUN4 domain-containing protein [Tychonema sp. BBK16]|uniref:GUN4 domain-containing protein n=1 Tax=Tychonema sp. BBK16 TaxID=2699888 RepID=UPI001F244828|nr:GUN4 domain-containing protein [Tychonema sp. BBK16]MCF6372145.1 GUN4 domain-containing protein [Tychonema sp. BBK16]
MKSRSCWLIFTLIGLSLTSCGQQKSSQEIAETVKNSIVLISYQNEGGHGTGFIVPGETGVCTVLTARHVVEGRSLNLLTNDQKLYQTDSIQTSSNLDLAVVTFPSAGDKCSYPSLNFGDSDSVKQTDQIYISGFPDRAGGGKLVRQFVRGYVSELNVLDQGYGISYDANTFSGMSGGPVLDTSGKVVAVHGKTDAQIIADLQSQQASLSDQQKATLQQAAARVAGGVQINTFKWGIPIKNYLVNQSNLVSQPIVAKPPDAGNKSIVTKLPDSGEPPITKADYSKLSKLLEDGKWKEADEETGNKMLEVAGKQKERYLTTEDIENFSCPDLLAIDKLWVKYSDGRFGFSVQKRIYKSLGGAKEYDQKIWSNFGEAIGWKKKEGDWLRDDLLTWNKDQPEAYLPMSTNVASNLNDGDNTLRHRGGIFFSHAETCKL